MELIAAIAYAGIDTAAKYRYPKYKLPIRDNPPQPYPYIPESDKLYHSTVKKARAVSGRSRTPVCEKNDICHMDFLTDDTTALLQNEL